MVFIMCVSLDHSPLFHFNLAIAFFLNLLLYPVPILSLRQVPKLHLYLRLHLRCPKLI